MRRLSLSQLKSQARQRGLSVRRSDTKVRLMRRLRAHPNVDLRKTKVVFMSADRTPKTLSESVPLGIAGFIVKPPQAPALKLKLEQALKFCQ